MKKLNLTVFVFATTLFLVGCSTTSTSDSSASAAVNAESEKVVVTRDPEDIKGKTKVGDVSASAQKVFGSPESLRQKATAKIKQDAASKGATIVLIQKDDFQATPINNVNLIGVAYK